MLDPDLGLLERYRGEHPKSAVTTLTVVAASRYSKIAFASATGCPAFAEIGTRPASLSRAIPSPGRDIGKGPCVSRIDGAFT
jgi:hypothetical protein